MDVWSFNVTAAHPSPLNSTSFNGKRKLKTMSSHRPYRPAQGIDKALEEITQNKGLFYDTNVVEICVKLFQEKNFRFDEKTAPIP